MNSRAKGKRGERQWRDELRANGYLARRGQQFSGSSESPDVIGDELDWIHFEVKAVERLNIEDAMDQARRDAGQEKTPVVSHKRNHRPWLVTVEAKTFFELIREFQPQRRGCTSPRPSPQSGEGGGAQGTARPTEKILGGSPIGAGASPVSQQTENT